MIPEHKRSLEQSYCYYNHEDPSLLELILPTDIVFPTQQLWQLKMWPSHAKDIDGWGGKAARLFPFLQIVGLLQTIFSSSSVSQNSWLGTDAGWEHYRINSSPHLMGSSSQLWAESAWTAPDRAEANKIYVNEVTSCAVWRQYGLSCLLLPFSQQAPSFHFRLPGGVPWSSGGLLLRTKISLSNIKTIISVNPSVFFFFSYTGLERSHIN